MKDFLHKQGASKQLGIYTASRLSSRMDGVIFREQLEGNTALNAHLEITLRDSVDEISRFIGIRIFSATETQKTPKGYVCSGGNEIIAYWFQHSIPVVLMVFDDGKIFWNSVTPENIGINNANWELTVPYEQIFDEDSIQEIGNLKCTSPNLARLAIDKSWLELLSNGEEILLDMEEWINQPSQRGALKLITPQKIYHWQFRTDPDMPHVMRLPKLFPWANIQNDEKFVKRDPDSALDSDSEFDAQILQPYAIEGGEIAKFRLKLTLNELGRAFLTAEPFICTGRLPNDNQKIPGFGSDYEGSLKFRIFNNM